MMDKRVVLQQIARYRWQLISPKGCILVDDIALTDLYRAELWVKAYISSFLGWSYTINRMEDKWKTK